MQAFYKLKHIFINYTKKRAKRTFMDYKADPLFGLTFNLHQGQGTLVWSEYW